MSDLPDYLVDQLIKVLIRRDYLDRRATLQNDEDPTTPDAPTSYETATFYKGKFFPRGCRGLIESVSIYCKRTLAGTLQLRLAPFPGMGPLATITVTPSSDWGWAVTNHRQMWNYDGLFIWVSDIGADVSYGYDELGTPDAYTSTSAQAVWQAETRRYAIRVDGKGFTPGDLPVSGTVNAILVPTSIAAVTSGATTVPDLVATSLAILEGSGRMLRLHIYAESVSALLSIQIYCDGTLIDLFVNGTTMEPALNAYPAKIYIDTTNTRTHWVINISYPFKRKLEVKAFQSSGGNVTYTVARLLCEVLS